MTVYKIQNAAGLYSTGGTAPRWTKQGKTWVALNHLRAHLTLLKTEQRRFLAALKDERTRVRYEAIRTVNGIDKSLNPYVGCEVVAYAVQETWRSGAEWGCLGVTR